MKPRPLVILFWNELPKSSVNQAPAEAGEHAAQDHVPIAQPDDVDADRLGRLGVLADGPRAQAPARAEQQRPGGRSRGRSTDIVIGPCVQEHLEEPADDRQVGQRTAGGSNALELAAPSAARLRLRSRFR